MLFQNTITAQETAYGTTPTQQMQTVAPGDRQKSSEVTNIIDFEKEAKLRGYEIRNTTRLASDPLSSTEITERNGKRQQQVATQGYDEYSFRNERVSVMGKNPDAQRVIRAHFTKEILAELSKIQKYCGQAAAAIFANEVLRKILRFRDQATDDPFFAILSALYDAMAFRNRWCSYNANQYQGASEILKKYANRDLNSDKVKKAITELEHLGFDTIPFEIDPFFFQEEDNDKT
jgi:hypothetical protein